MSSLSPKTLGIPPEDRKKELEGATSEQYTEQEFRAAMALSALKGPGWFLALLLGAGLGYWLSWWLYLVPLVLYGLFLYLLERRGLEMPVPIDMEPNDPE